MRIRAEGRTRKTTCVNLIGEMRPDGDANDIIIMGSHLDSFHLAPGVLDDLMGVIVATEIARALAPFTKHFTRTLRTVCFTAEELWMAGSKEYVRRHPDDLNRFLFLVNMDGIYCRDAEHAVLGVIGSPEMRDYVERSLDNLHPNAHIRNHFGTYADYLPFVLTGIPALQPCDETPPGIIHSRADTVENAPIGWTRSSPAVVYARLLLKLLTDPEALSARRRGPDEIRELLKREGVERECMSYLKPSQVGLGV